MDRGIVCSDAGCASALVPTALETPLIEARNVERADRSIPFTGCLGQAPLVGVMLAVRNAVRHAPASASTPC
jgi:hypothetical protein